MTEQASSEADNQDFVVSAFPAEGHDHQRCAREALERAEQLCASRGRRLTPLRRRVLELVWESHQPVKAYDLLARLRGEFGNAAPPTVYRALDFLLAEHLVHRLASMNAFVGCARPTDCHSGQFLICRHCEMVAELEDPALNDLLEHQAAAVGFTLEGQTIELKGVCSRCQEKLGE